jgi:hypothetical protein
MKKYSPPALMIKIIPVTMGRDIATVTSNFLMVSLKKKPRVWK